MSFHCSAQKELETKQLVKRVYLVQKWAGRLRSGSFYVNALSWKCHREAPVPQWLKIIPQSHFLPVPYFCVFWASLMWVSIGELPKRRWWFLPPMPPPSSSFPNVHFTRKTSSSGPASSPKMSWIVLESTSSWLEKPITLKALVEFQLKRSDKLEYLGESISVYVFVNCSWTYRKIQYRNTFEYIFKVQ